MYTIAMTDRTLTLRGETVLSEYVAEYEACAEQAFKFAYDTALIEYQAEITCTNTTPLTYTVYLPQSRSHIDYSVVEDNDDYPRRTS